MSESEVVFIEIEVFEKAESSLVESKESNEFLTRFLNQLKQCKLNDPSPIQTNKFQGNQGRYQRDSRGPRQRDPRQRDPRRRYDESHGERSAQWSTETQENPRKKTKTIMGLLNKVSPRNIDSIMKQVLDMCESNGVDEKTIYDIVEHSIKQPSYLNMFIKILGELARIKGGLLVSKVVNTSVRRHINEPFVSFLKSLEEYSDKLKGEHAKVIEYEVFCRKNKEISTLKSVVSFTVGCIRSQLCDVIDLPDYIDVVCDNLKTSTKSPHDLEILFDVVEVLLKCCDRRVQSLMVSKMTDWAEERENGINDLSSRAKFKLQSIIEVA